MAIAMEDLPGGILRVILDGRLDIEGDTVIPVCGDLETALAALQYSGATKS